MSVSAAERALAAALAGRSRLTGRAYRSDLRAYAKWVGADLDAACERLFAMTGPQANEHAAEWLAAMTAEGLAPATIGRRLVTLSALLKGARIIGATSVPALELRRPKTASLRDTSGLPWETVKEAIAAASVRDAAILSLLLMNGLRRGEVAGLRLADLELDQRRIWILGKARTERETVTVQQPVIDALTAYLAERGNAKGPLFLGRTGKGLSGQAIGEVAIRAGRRVGAAKPMRAHSLRHTFVSEALRRGAPLQSVQKAARHSSPAITMIYADHLRDEAAEVGALLVDEAA